MMTNHLIKTNALAIIMLLLAQYVHADDLVDPLSGASSNKPATVGLIPAPASGKATPQSTTTPPVAQTRAVDAHASSTAAPPATDAPTVARKREQPDPVLYRQLAALRSQNALLTESLKNAELRFKLGASSGNQPIVPAITHTPGSGNAGIGPESLGPSAARVHLVSGSGDKLSAQISVPGGGRVTARVGSHVPSLGLVKSISLNEVVVENDNVTSVVPFAADPSETAPQPNFQSGGAF